MKFKNILICFFSAVLAASCILWPSLISGYQDKKMRGRVELDKVEDTSEIRTDTLTIEEKLSLIAEADNSAEEIAVTNQTYEWGSAEIDEFKNVCMKELKQLKEMGMFPKLALNKNTMMFYETTTTCLDTKNYARRLRIHSVTVQSGDQSLVAVIDDSSHKILSIDSVKGARIKPSDAEKIIGIWGRYLGLKETNKMAAVKNNYFVTYRSGSEKVYYLFIFFSKKFAEEGEFYIHPEGNGGDQNSVSR